MASARLSDVAVFGDIRSRSRAPVQADADAADMTLVNLLTIDLVLAVLGQKVAIPMAGSQLALVAFSNFAVMAILFRLGRLTFSPWRCLMFLLTFGSAILLQLIGPRFNIGSFLLTCTTTLPFITVARVTEVTYLRFLGRFQLVAAAAVGLVFLDHALQLVHIGMPDLERIIPEPMRYVNFVYVQPLFWNSSLNKPNGIFFLEAAFISQFIAMALIIELALFHRIRLISLYGAGMMAVFAGTGFVLLVAAAPILLARYLKAKLLLFGIIVIPIAVGIAMASGWADIMTRRVAEFDQAGSSGHARFIAPFASIADQFKAPPLELMTGQGAGMQEKSTDIMLIPATKMLLEYGLITTTIYMIFTLTCIFGAGVPVLCAWTLFVNFHVMNGGSSQPLTAVYCYLLVAAYQVVRPSAQHRRAAAFASPSWHALSTASVSDVFAALPGRAANLP